MGFYDCRFIARAFDDYDTFTSSAQCKRTVERPPDQERSSKQISNQISTEPCMDRVVEERHVMTNSDGGWAAASERVVGGRDS